MNILFLDKDRILRDYVSMLIETAFDCDITGVSTIAKAKQLLENEISIIIAAFDFEDGNLIDFFESRESTLSKIPILFFDIAPPSDYLGIDKVLKAHPESAHLIKPFKDAHFFPVFERMYDHQDELIQKSKIVPFNTENTKEPNENRTEVDADWQIKKDFKNTGEQEADWDIKKDFKNAGEQEADWDIKKERSGENEADWEIKNEFQDSGEEDADWDIRKERSGENEADWEIKKEFQNSGEVEADWKIQKSENTSSTPPSNKKNLVINGYIGVKIERFLSLNSTACDLYLKLGRQKFVKRFPANDLFSSKEIQSYISKKCDYLYIKEDEYQLFADSWGQMISSMMAIQTSSSKVKTTGSLVAVKHIHEQLQQFGVSKTVVELAHKTVESCISLLNSDDKIKKLLKNIMRGEDFLSEHSLMLSYICNEIANNMGWNNPSTLQKLTLACLLHDSLLKDERIAKIQTLDEAKSLGLDKNDLKTMTEHPDKVAELVQKMQNTYPDVDTIIAQHHERPDGQGFPRKLGALSISPLACLMIIAEDFVQKILKGQANPENMELIKAEFKSIYDRGNFKKPLQGFLASF